MREWIGNHLSALFKDFAKLLVMNIFLSQKVIGLLMLRQY
ncbi:Uncharacterised protein [Staphylococcus saccharolyticus]|uniref:Uncharacterized protein n=1 Tax=Staphylococcus saccharolyticus TaxID=33028 RepID=A0A380H293_9STAP|nr:Uncharacterised protein [Staphylococcus saccharolyticus]